MIAVALAVAVALAPGGIAIVGDATCPAPAEVAAQVAALGPAPGAATPSGDAAAPKVIVARTERTLRLELVGPNSNALATRELPAEGSCGDLAAAAAIVVAAWRADLDPDLTPQVTLPARPVPAPATPPTVIERAAPAPRAPTPFAIGLGLIASETGGNFAPGAMLVGALGLGWRGLALDASVSGTTSRSADVGALSGAASWTRAALAIGPALQFGDTRVRGDVHLQALAALLHVRGVGIPNAASDTTTEVGLSAGARGELVSGTTGVWLGLDAFGWPGDQRLTIANTKDVSQLPRLELVGSIGISLDRFP
jgi:hypothetical protein